MDPTRREFIAGSAAALALGAHIPLKSIVPRDEMKELCEHAIDAATAAGATYADVRIVRARSQYIRARDLRLDRISDSESFGFGVRVIKGGAWGFAASDAVTRDEIAAVARRAVAIAEAGATTVKRPVELVPVGKYIDHWVTPVKKDPFAVPIEDKVGLLLRVNETLMKTPQVKKAESWLSFQFEHKWFMSTEGSFIEQEITRAYPEFSATAVGEGEFETRMYQCPPLNIGYEHIEAMKLVENAERVAGEAVEKLKAPKGPVGVHRDLVLMPSHMFLTIHESIGHPTELDRALGWEADYAGTSFLTPEKLGTFRYGSDKLNITGDRTFPNGRGTCGYDDDGVRSRKWYMIKNGIFVGYPTTRETAPFVGESTSTGANYADSWDSTPIQRMPNIQMEPDPDGPSKEQIIADTRDGILIEGRGSYSIDQQRYNFQFGGDAFWEIKNGKVTRMLRDVTYHGITPEFWAKLDRVGHPDTWEPFGTNRCGKGQPSQRAEPSHGSPVCRFRDVEIGGAFRG